MRHFWRCPLTESQCIEIVDKLWGWNAKKVESEWVYSDAYKHTGNGFTKEQWLKGEVNSWQGFGRTVEAMAGKKWVFTDGEFYLCFLSHIGKQVPIVVIDDWNDPKNLIEATHLAALEAIANDTSRA